MLRKYSVEMLGNLMMTGQWPPCSLYVLADEDQLDRITLVFHV